MCHSVRKPSSSHKLLPSKCRYHDAADVACLPLLLLQQSGYCGRSLSGHLHGHDLSSSISVLILEIHNAVVAVPADVTSLGCHCPPNMFYASDCFFDIFQMMMTKVWYCHGHDLCPASRDLLRCPAIVWLVWIAGFLVGTAAIGKKGSVPWCCKLHASHRSRRKHPQRYNEPNSLVTSTTSCTNLLHTRTIQCKEFVLRSLRPRLLRLTSKHHCRIDMQTEQWSSLWTYQFPHKLPHQTNRAPHVLARMH